MHKCRVYIYDDRIIVWIGNVKLVKRLIMPTELIWSHVGEVNLGTLYQFDNAINNAIRLGAMLDIVINTCADIVQLTVDQNNSLISMGGHTLHVGELTELVDNRTIKLNSPILFTVAEVQVIKDALEHTEADCWATGPMTGNYGDDHVTCPGCRALNIIQEVEKRQRREVY